MQKYRDKNIRVCDQNSIPLVILKGKLTWFEEVFAIDNLQWCHLNNHPKMRRVIPSFYRLKTCELGFPEKGHVDGYYCINKKEESSLS